MSGYVARRVAQLVPVLLIVSAVVFFVFRIIPGDVAEKAAFAHHPCVQGVDW